MANEPDDGYPARPSRRRALHALTAMAGLPTALPLGKAVAASAALLLKPAVYDAFDGSALVSVCASQALALHVRWRVKTAATTRATDQEFNQRSAVVRLTADSDFIGPIALSGLPSSALIQYVVFAGDERVSTVQQFRMPAAAKDASTDFALAFSGDVEERHRPFRLFDVMRAATPDYFLHLGDTIYADIPKRDFSPTLTHYRRKHFANCSDSAWQNFAASVVTFATWDDHEIENDANRDHPARSPAQKAFREYWPCRTVTDTGLYRRVSLGSDVDLFILDTRSFRSPQSDDDDEQKTILGTAQKQWFIDAYRASRAKFRLIATSVPFHGGSKDAWGNYASERDELFALFKAARKSQSAQTILLSADYHFAREWPKDEKSGVFEFTAGPIASFLTFSKDNAAKSRNSRGDHFVYGDSENFGLLRYSAKEQALYLGYVAAGGRTLHQRKIVSA
jgi:alkaline phosphatase D